MQQIIGWTLAVAWVLFYLFLKKKDVIKQECAFWLSVFKCPREAVSITVSYFLDYTRDNLEPSNLQWQRCAKAMCLAYPTELKHSLIMRAPLNVKEGSGMWAFTYYKLHHLHTSSFCTGKKWCFLTKCWALLQQSLFFLMSSFCADLPFPPSSCTPLLQRK